MRRIMITMFVIIFCISLLVGCDNVLLKNNNTLTDGQVAAPSDFAVHFEILMGDYPIDVMDTYEGYIQKALDHDSVSKKNYSPSYAELCQLYQFILSLEYRTELDFSKPITYDNYANEEKNVFTDPHICYYLKFTANGKTIEISGDATARECIDESEEARCFIQAINDIGDFYRNTEVYKSIPEVNGDYL